MNLLSKRRLRNKIIFLTVGNEKHLTDIESGKTLHIAKQGRMFLDCGNEFGASPSGFV